MHLRDKLIKDLHLRGVKDCVNPLLFPAQLPARVISYGHEYWPSGHEFTRENSDINALELICAGDAIYEQDGVRSHVKAGSLYILRSGVAHRYYTGPEGWILKRFINISGQELNNYLRMFRLEEKNHIELGSSYNKVKNHFKEIRCSFNMKLEERIYYQAGILHDILALCGRHVGKVYPRPLRKVLEEMSRDLSQNLEITDMCRISGLGQTSLFNLFKQELQVSPIQYYRQLKIDVGAEMLRNSNEKISTIARRLGFKDPLYFSNTFKKIKGSSPKKFRQTLS